MSPTRAFKSSFFAMLKSSASSFHSFIYVFFSKVNVSAGQVVRMPSSPSLARRRAQGGMTLPSML